MLLLRRGPTSMSGRMRSNGTEFEAILITASGCGTMIKDYGFLLRNDPAYAAKAARSRCSPRILPNFWVIAICRSLPIRRVLSSPIIPPVRCSMARKSTPCPSSFSTQAGFKVRDVPEGHLCCGSAGTYNILEPEIATRLRDRKIANIARTAPDLIATGNIGCITQLASGTTIPVLHTIELLDFVYGGPKPLGLR